MSETLREFEISKESKLAILVQKTVELLAVFEKEDPDNRDALRLGYYDAPQEGAVLHGGVYFGHHRDWLGTDQGFLNMYRITLLRPKSQPNYDNGVLTLEAAEGALRVDDTDFGVDNQETVENFLDWLAASKLILTDEAEQLTKARR